MKTRNIALSLAKVVSGSVLTAALVVAGTQLMNAPSDISEGSESNKGSSLFTLFETKEKVTQVHYLEMKNQVITLKGNGAKERYLLLDLAYITNSAEEQKITEHNLPKLKSTLVGMFSGMEYDTARTMTTDDIRLQMLTRYEGVFGNHQPFADVIISKMVFQ